ncbi:MAG TPA: hypothetical protein VNV16_14940 [Methylibium sp.]|nr:hypothetical protein [Methylibium sp.]
MSEVDFLRQHDAAFFAAWAGVTGGLDASYSAPGSVTPVTCQVLVDHDVDQFLPDDDAAPVSIMATKATFRREQLEPATGGTLVVDGNTYRLLQRVSGSDPSLSVWTLEKVAP